MTSSPRNEGFRGQFLHFSTPALRAELARHPMVAGFQVIHIGSFPQARGHGVERSVGLEESILICCIRGFGWFEIEGDRGRVGPGQALLIPPGKSHRYGADPESPWSIRWAHFGGAAAVEYSLLMPPGQYILTIPENETPEVERLFRRSFRSILSRADARALLFTSHAVRYILGILFFRGPQLPNRLGRLARHDFSENILFMRQNLTRNLSLAELAAQARLSPSRYSALFKKQTGRSPIEHHIHLRMQAAARLLDSTSLTIKEIATRMGYEDPYYFSRSFRKITNCAPLNYKRAIKG